jgi:hypothetical protein
LLEMTPTPLALAGGLTSSLQPARAG